MTRREDDEGLTRVEGRTTTVGALIDALSAFDRSLPVLVDGYEDGFLHPLKPEYIAVGEHPRKGGMYGDYECCPLDGAAAVVLRRDDGWA